MDLTHWILLGVLGLVAAIVVGGFVAMARILRTRPSTLRPSWRSATCASASSAVRSSAPRYSWHISRPRPGRSSSPWGSGGRRALPSVALTHQLLTAARRLRLAGYHGAAVFDVLARRSGLPPSEKRSTLVSAA